MTSSILFQNSGLLVRDRGGAAMEEDRITIDTRATDWSKHERNQFVVSYAFEFEFGDGQNKTSEYKRYQSKRKRMWLVSKWLMFKGSVLLCINVLSLSFFFNLTAINKVSSRPLCDWWRWAFLILSECSIWKGRPALTRFGF